MINSKDNNLSHKKPVVYRITVDEILSDDLIRILVSFLAGEHGINFTDENFGYGEKEIMIDPGNYEREMGIRDPRQYPITAFQEGQVFFSGNFEILKDEPDEPVFRINAEAHGFERVDWFIKERIRDLYNRALQREMGNASDQR